METRKARYERRQRARKERRRESGRARLRNLRRTLLLVAGGVAAIVLVVGGFTLFITTRSTFGKELPPTSFSPAHSESMPAQQINTFPIPRLVQEHVMERQASHERGSMLVQYNCVQYQCEPDLVERLTEIVRDYPPYGAGYKLQFVGAGYQVISVAVAGWHYPPYVYLAPYPTMALTPKSPWRHRGWLQAPICWGWIPALSQWQWLVGRGKIRNQEVMHQHLLRRSLGTQLPPTVLEGPHQFLLLRVHGDHRLSQGELQLHRPVQVLWALRSGCSVPARVLRLACKL